MIVLIVPANIFPVVPAHLVMVNIFLANACQVIPGIFIPVHAKVNAIHPINIPVFHHQATT